MIRHITITLIFFISLCSSLYSQTAAVNDESRLVRLIKAQSAEMYQSDFRDIRRVTGPAQFLHNNTLIICDTAIWDLKQNVVDAIGNVKIIQGKTILSGDKVHYLADSSLAQVRGSLVELLDKDSNRLRTNYLDYNTKDSIAYFYNGGSMMDKSGKVIESFYGYYHSKIERFKFLQKVEMTTDSMVLKSDSLAYWSAVNRVDFLGSTYAWQEDGFLSAMSGWYDRDKEHYNFERSAYLLNKENEVWAERILYMNDSSRAELFNNVQILDTAQSMIIFSDYAKYRGEPVYAELYKNPSIAYYSIEDGVKDTLFFAADTIKYKTVSRNSVDSLSYKAFLKRYQESKRDPIAEMYGKKVSTPPPLKKGEEVEIEITAEETAVEETAVEETAKDTLYRYIDANKNVRFFRSNLQGRSDSLSFNSIDSIIRLYKNPVIWSEDNQFTSDSIQIVISEKRLKKADLISNAFVISKEDSIHFNQIKATDISAYFQNGELSRFDAFGGVSVLFFIAEDSIITTMNQKESRAMKAIIQDKQISKVWYYENVQSDAYPIIDLDKSKKRLRGFKLRLSERPLSRLDVCNRIIRPSKRLEVSSYTLPIFTYTKIFFGITPQLPPLGAKKEAEQLIKETPPKDESSEILPDIER